MAWDEGRFLSCGSSKHKRRNCPDNLDEPEELEYSESKNAHKGDSETEQTDTLAESEVSTSTESEEDEEEEHYQTLDLVRFVSYGPENDY
eukprot:262907-Rhodomonas_salina.1